MNINKKVFSLFFLMAASFASVAQDWIPGDTLNTQPSDTSRIQEFRGNAIDLTGKDLIDASFPNSWPLFGTKTRISLGGYVKLDYIQDFDGSYNRYQFPIEAIPIPNDGRPDQSGYMNLHARESRFNIDVRSVTKNGTPIQVYIEMDFFNLDRGEFNQTPRLRHFYGVLGRWLIGRTWGTQTDVFAIPSTIDFAVGDAITATRRAQLRFEDKISKRLNYAVALEMVEFPGIDNGGQPGQASQLLPSLVGRLTKTTESGGRLMLGASIFQLRWDGLGQIPNSTAMGWGINFSGREYFGSGHYFSWVTSFGDAWGTNLLSNLGSDASAIINQQGELETMPTYNASGTVSIYIIPTLVTNLNLSWFEIVSPDFRDGDKIQGGASAHLNVIWSPVKQVNGGIEYMIARRTNKDNQSGVADRIQIMIKYFF